MITQTKLENLAEKYEVEDFIKNDPIQFPHRFTSRHCETLVSGSDAQYTPKQRILARVSETKLVLARETTLSRAANNPRQSPSHLQDIEIAAFVSSLFAYGNRKIFIKKLDELFKIMQNKPLDFVLNFNPEKLKGFNYRFAKDFDVIEVFNILHKLYKHDGGLKKLFEYGYSLPSPFAGEEIFQHEERVLENLVRGKLQTMLQAVTDYFYSNVKNEVSMGFYHLIPNPKNGGAMKRMNMFLRWMVRKAPVDLGLWDFIPASELLIPLDVHVARLSRKMGLLKRNSNDFKAVLELTEKLKEFEAQDPVKFDFAIFGLGVNGGMEV